MASSCLAADALSFSSLAANPRWLAPLAEILLAERRAAGGAGNLATVRSRLAAEQRGQLPETTLALTHGGLVACASLGPLPGHPDQGLWLSNLWVHPRHRSQGIGRLLCERLCRQARACGEQALQLYTHSHLDYYRPLGWQPVRAATIGGRACHVLIRPL